jgi:beta-lactamase class A
MFSKRLIVIISLSFLLGIVTEYSFVTIAHSSRAAKGPAVSLVTKDFGYSLIKPLVLCETPRDASDNEGLKSIRKHVEKTMQRDLQSHRITTASVYFRDLDNGIWFSLGSKEQFEPASLMKVPIMMAILRQAEKDPKLLQRKVKFSVPQDLYEVQRIMPPTMMEQGKSYTIDDLLFRMIAYSDNNATYLLEDVMAAATREEVFADMRVESPYKDANSDVHVTTDDYARFFRVLYNATYLGNDMSEKALEYLASTTFADGLVAGVPADTMVAHKFGERTEEHEPNVKYLSDCGIVYYPQHPYLLCVMTKGNDFEKLGETIREVSRGVYAEFDKRYR